MLYLGVSGCGLNHTLLKIKKLKYIHLARYNTYVVFKGERVRAKSYSVKNKNT